MPSSVIRRYVYATDSGDLWVEFVSGRRYVYSGAPLEVAETLGSAASKGTYFNTRIRDRFPCREIAQEDAPRD